VSDAKLDEAALRRPEFTEGHRIKLGDGQEWTFPKPRIRFFPVRDKSGGIDVGMKADFGEAHRETLAALMDRTGDDIEAGVERFRLRLELAVGLLTQNYDLDDAALQTLLAMDFDDPALVEMWTKLGDVLQGRSPKP